MPGQKLRPVQKSAPGLQQVTRIRKVYVYRISDPIALSTPAPSCPVMPWGVRDHYLHGSLTLWLGM